MSVGSNGDPFMPAGSPSYDGRTPIFVELGADPSVSPGHQAPIGSIARFGTTYFLKTAASATSWSTSFGGFTGGANSVAITDGAGALTTSADITFNDATNILLLAGATKLALRASGNYINSGFTGEIAIVSANTQLARFENGTVQFFAGLRLPDRAVASGTTLGVFDSLVLADAGGGAFDVTLPSAVTFANAIYTVKRMNSGANAVTIKSAAGTVEGVAAATGVALTSQYQARVCQSDGANWWFIGGIG